MGELTEACFQETPMPFADDSKLMLSNGTVIKLKSTFVSEGTLPVGSTWQMLPIPDTHTVHQAQIDVCVRRYVARRVNVANATDPRYPHSSSSTNRRLCQKVRCPSGQRGKCYRSPIPTQFIQ